MAAGYVTRSSALRVGRTMSGPAQLGQVPASRSCAHSRQKVHSKEQIIASGLVPSRSRSQHSQFGLSTSIGLSLVVGVTLVFQA